MLNNQFQITEEQFQEKIKNLRKVINIDEVIPYLNDYLGIFGDQVKCVGLFYKGFDEKGCYLEFYFLIFTIKVNDSNLYYIKQLSEENNKQLNKVLKIYSQHNERTIKELRLSLYNNDRDHD